MNKLDVIVPVLNEEKSLLELVGRISRTLNRSRIAYGIIVVDDHSTDRTKNLITKLARQYPITFITKQGQRGKAFSIFEGMAFSGAKYVAMIDGDLQYSPEYLPAMLKKAEKDNLGVVIGNRTVHKESRLRYFISKVGHLIYANLILGLRNDTQSGLKLFKRSIAEHLVEKDFKSWAFDLPLLYTAKELGEKIGSVDIDFLERKNGISKINFVKTTWEILTTALKLRLGSRKVYRVFPDKEGSMVGAGVVYKKKKFITHTTLHHSKSALVTFTSPQKIALLAIFFALIIGLFVNTLATEIVIIGFLSTIYFADVFFGLYLVLKSLHAPPEIKFEEARLKRLKDDYLPVYTILSPLYKEAHILPQFIKNIQNLDWPKSKLDVILLFEADDKESIEAASKINLPSYFRVLVVPDSNPKTKPKACNYGLAHAKGEYVVIYDAEDMPERDQLKKAFLGFQNVTPNVFCLQAKLNYYNPHQNLLTRLFTAEYSLWFDIVLPGLQSINTTIPLGGTSNHFRTNDLKKLEGWDPFNVAEDADLGARLFRNGYKTAIIDSITLEEANSDVKNWIRQRSRWLKGYIQTYFVQMRSPLKFAREQKLHYFIFQLVNGLRVSFMLINPFLWAMTAAYFLLHKYVGPQIEALYPTYIFYMAVFSAVFGNFLYLYYYMIGAAKRGQWGIIKYIFLVPFYWLLTSVGAFAAFYQLIFKPHFWEKTIHGLNKAIAKEKKIATKVEFAFIKNLGIPKLPPLTNLIKSNYFAGAFLIGATLLSNILNFLYNAYLSRSLTLDEFGLIGLVTSIIYLTQVPIAAITSAVAHKSAFLLGKYNSPVRAFWQKARSQSIKISIVISVIWLILTPLLMQVFKSNTFVPIIIFVPIWLVGLASAVDIGFINGNLFFVATGIVAITEAVVKLLLSVGLVEAGQGYWVYTAVPASMLVAFLIGWYFARRIKDKEINLEIPNINFPRKFFASSIINRLSGIVFLSLDIIVAKIFLDPQSAGLYALLSLAGKMVYLFGSQFTAFIVPMISKKEGEGESSESTFNKLLGATTFSSMAAFVLIGLFGSFTAPLLFGEKIIPVVNFLPFYSLAIAFQTITTSIILYHQSKNEHAFSIVGFLFAILQLGGLLLFHDSIEAITWVMFFAGFDFLLLTLCVHVYYDQLRTVARNVLDLFGLFAPKEALAPKQAGDRLNILIFNWRDKRHVWSGGAEVYLHELAKRWVVMGHSVTLFCGNDGYCPRQETVDGIKIIRRGGFYTVFLWAALYYMLKFRGRFDEIIDSENGIPFFAPLYAKEKVFLLIHHVHQDVFRMKLHPPLSWIGKSLEKHFVPMIYKNTEVITVSPSSKADILEHKLTKKEPNVIYNGVDLEVYKPGRKSARPSILYLGRLSKQKSLSVLIKSAKKIVRNVPDVQITIAGDGVDRKRLIKLTKSLHLENVINFTGKVTEKEKVKLYQKAWVFVNPSLMEGWGITTIEANACGTPVVASNVAGLRDAVHNPHSGLLVPYGNVDEFANSISLLIKNGAIRKRMSSEAITWAKKFSWDKSATDTLNLF
jgi:cellulose synthase/poly-beta-1,6-N-acetylglucosamine synthase-like glycosyltransferase/glycosyltransferase involved in cell wall biosynthesis/O-antigen/teichoic acid export membrane protein